MKIAEMRLRLRSAWRALHETNNASPYVLLTKAEDELNHVRKELEQANKRRHA